MSRDKVQELLALREQHKREEEELLNKAQAEEQK